MSAASNYTENNVMNALLRGQTFQQATSIYVSLNTANPGESGGSEVSTANWPSYARLDAALGGSIDTGWTVANDGVCKNAKQLIYAVHDGASDITVSHYALYDDQTGGNMLTYAPLNNPRTLSPGDVFVIDVDKLTVQML